MSKIRTEISIESSESFVVRRKRHSVRSWCVDCGRVSIFVRPTEAGFLAGLDIDSIVSFIYSGELHVSRVGHRGIFVCLTSLCQRAYTAGNHDEDALFEEVALLSGFEEDGLSIGKLK